MLWGSFDTCLSLRTNMWKFMLESMFMILTHVVSVAFSHFGNIFELISSPCWPHIAKSAIFGPYSPLIFLIYNNEEFIYLVWNCITTFIVFGSLLHAKFHDINLKAVYKKRCMLQNWSRTCSKSEGFQWLRQFRYNTMYIEFPFSDPIVFSASITYPSTALLKVLERNVCLSCFCKGSIPYTLPAPSFLLSLSISLAWREVFGRDSIKSLVFVKVSWEGDALKRWMRWLRVTSTGAVYISLFAVVEFT